MFGLASRSAALAVRRKREWCSFRATDANQQGTSAALAERASLDLA